jgi:hypothetical protein
MLPPKVLFILKKKHLYGTSINEPKSDYSKSINSGLFNSANFVNNMLNEKNIESHIVEVTDNNDIDREVTKYQPTHVIIEAIWVVPEKFTILHKLHPDVKWIIRLHSEMPFIANEGNALDWIYKYSALSEELNLRIAPNTLKMYNDLKGVGINHLLYLPNYYPIIENKFIRPTHKNHIDIGCFGAIRPMKNQLIQAIAAIKFGEKMNKGIKFHINAERIERGDNALRNIRALFENQTKHELIEHPWLNHSSFIEVIKGMDIVMAVSINETFCIVAADAVINNIPVVGSDEISWLNRFYKSEITTSEDIIKHLSFAYRTRKFNLQKLNFHGLREFSRRSGDIWLYYVMS